jgi:hypothetical protein
MTTIGNVPALALLGAYVYLDYIMFDVMERQASGGTTGERCDRCQRHSLELSQDGREHFCPDCQCQLEEDDLLAREYQLELNRIEAEKD